MEITFEYPWYMYALCVLAGMVAGFINTLAGSGSLVTLALLVFLGLPADVANGTNRVGVVFQSIIGFGVVYRNSRYSYRGILPIVGVALLGAILGARIAADLDEEVMNLTIGSLMVFMLFVILIKPKRWLRQREPEEGRRRAPWLLFIFFLIGMYGGFIQAGVGIFLLAALVLGAHYNLIQANAIKLLIVLVYAIPTLIVFAIDGDVHWGYGILLSIGQAGGAWGAARFATSSSRAEIWIRRLLIAIVLVSIVKFFRLDQWIF